MTWQTFIYGFLIPFLVYGSITGICNALLSRKSQIEHWAEQNPRAAAVQKFMRAVGFDPWNLIAAGKLWSQGKLPLAQKAGAVVVEDGKIKPTKARAMPLGPMAMLTLCAMLALTPLACIPHGQPTTAADAAAQVPRDVAIAYAALCTALELADTIEVQHLDSLKNPTQAQLDQAEAVIAKLKMVRAALAQVRDDFQTGREKLRSALGDLSSAVNLAQLAGLNIPDAVWKGIDAAKAVLS